MSAPTRRVVLSGVQPTADSLHLGNALGAVKQWVGLQDDHDTFFCVVDLHAITVPQDPGVLRRRTLVTAAQYLALGIDPSRSTIFVQSHVPAHTELSWVLGCFTGFGQASRMTQFKDKSAKQGADSATVGLFTYPVLQAADVLLYDTNMVPVGEDQRQHLELARNIAQKFNHDYGVDFFPLTEPLILGEATRVMSLRDGTKKMSKSDPSDYSRINLTDGPDAIRLKVQKARTDPNPLPEEVEGLEERAEARNLVGIYAALADTTRAEVLRQHGGKSFSSFKESLSDLAASVLGPIGQEMQRLVADPAEVDRILKDGAERADAIAEPILAEAKRLVGFLNVRDR